MISASSFRRSEHVSAANISPSGSITHREGPLVERKKRKGKKRKKKGQIRVSSPSPSSLEESTEQVCPFT